MGMQLVETITVGSGGAASIEFTSIPQDGVDLMLVVSAKAPTTNYRNLLWRFNSDTGANYSGRDLYGTGSSAASSSYSSITAFYSSAFSVTPYEFSSASLYIPNYAGATTKSCSMDIVGEYNGTVAGQGLIAGLWNSTAAITGITVKLSLENLVEHSTASLYKITTD